MENGELSSTEERKFSLYHDLMQIKVMNILLISSPYDAWVMEEDCKISERIVSEYRGLNLSSPPRLTWVSSVDEAMAMLDSQNFELVIIMPHQYRIEAAETGKIIKAKIPEIPVVLLSHRELRNPGESMPEGLDNIFIWSGDAELLVALVKNLEDALNVRHDTAKVGIRVIIVVEDSARYLSSFLPILYKELVRQTQAVLEEGLNAEHRLLTMRARPKILTAGTYEEALKIYHEYESYVLGIISDVRFPKNGVLNENAGLELLEKVNSDRSDIPLLLASNEPENMEKAKTVNAYFVDKNSPDMLVEVRNFVLDHLGFGDFIFRTPNGQEISRAGSLYSLEKMLGSIEDDVFLDHCRNNDFSRWFYARTEIELANQVRPLRDYDFSDPETHREHIISLIRNRRMQRQQGVIVSFNPRDFDPETDFLKIGSGSIGGKARGLAFIGSLLERNRWVHEKYTDIRITAPKTLTIATSGFDDFIDMNGLKFLAKTDLTDAEVLDVVEEAIFPGWIEAQLWAYLHEIHYPLSVRSSSLLEDAQYQAYAGLYSTYMIPNDHPDLEVRLGQLVEAVKMVWASTFFNAPKSFSRRVNQRTDEEKMGVVVQQLCGQQYKDYYFPAFSGVGQSYNYYPFGRMKPEQGVASIAMGIGKSVVDGEQCLRFSPGLPKILPQCPTVEDSIRNTQTRFYALKMSGSEKVKIHTGSNLEQLDIADFTETLPVRKLASTYIAEEGRIRDTASLPGPKIMLFAPVLVHKIIPLANVLKDILSIAEKGMGGPVEIEFSVNMFEDAKPVMTLLQLRPMSARADLGKITISEEDINKAVCVSSHSLGNAVKQDIYDIVFVRMENFEVSATREIARDISAINSRLFKTDLKYILIGPGRWGSADPWLGVPVEWNDISAVSVIVEVASESLRVEPSQGSHFFHNITTLGINYMMVLESEGNMIDWDWLTSAYVVDQTEYVTHVRVEKNLVVKIDGRSSKGIIRPS
jgi:hypothetical protein